MTLSESGDVAQVVEHRLCKAGVRGSSPLVSTNYIAGNYLGRSHLTLGGQVDHSVRNGWAIRANARCVYPVGHDVEAVTE